MISLYPDADVWNSELLRKCCKNEKSQKEIFDGQGHPVGPFGGRGVEIQILLHLHWQPKPRLCLSDTLTQLRACSSFLPCCWEPLERTKREEACLIMMVFKGNFGFTTSKYLLSGRSRNQSQVLWGFPCWCWCFQFEASGPCCSPSSDSALWWARTINAFSLLLAVVGDQT